MACPNSYNCLPFEISQRSQHQHQHRRTANTIKHGMSMRDKVEAKRVFREQCIHDAIAATPDDAPPMCLAFL